LRFQCEKCKGIVAIDNDECGKPVGCGHCSKITMVPETRFSKSAVINDFVIQDVLGTGGMGKVYLAHQLSLDRPVALKILLEQFADEKEFVVDFIKEARAAARLNHPHIVQAYAVGADEGVYFFAMEYVEGTTLKDVLDERGKLPWREAFKVVRQISEALDFGWKNQQLVHRDIKPDNIMMAKDNVAKLADLGLARMATELKAEDSDHVMGTPQYISPEQLLGHTMDVRGDIYSLGATAYQVVTGNFPFVGNSLAEVARKHLTEPLKSPRDYVEDLPDRIVWIIQKMMEKAADDRFSGADVLQEAITAALDDRDPKGFDVGKYGAANSRPLSAESQELVCRQLDLQGPAQVIDRPGVVKKKKLILRDGAQTVMQPKKVSPENKPRLKPGGNTKSNSAGGKKTTLAPKGKTVLTTSPKSKGTGKGADGGATKLTTARPQTAAGEKPAKTGKSGSILVVLFVMFLVGIFAVGGGLYLYYAIGSRDKAEQFYFKKQPQESDGYFEIKPLLDKNYENLEFELRKVTDLTRGFIADYPDSIFVKAPADGQYAKLFNVPAPLDRVHDDAIAHRGKELAGIITTNHVQYEEWLLRLLRQRQHEEEQAEIEQRRVEHDLRLREHGADEDIGKILQTLLAEVTVLQERMEQVAIDVAEPVEQERVEVRESMIMFVQDFEFRELAAYLVEKMKKRPDHPILHEMERMVERDFEKDAVASAGGLSAKYSRPYDDRLEVLEMRTKLIQAVAAGDFESAKRDLKAGGAAISDVTADRSKWLKQNKKKIAQAKEMYDVVAKSAKTLEGKQCNVDVFRTNDLKYVVRVGARNVFLKSTVYNPAKQKRVEQTFSIPLEALSKKEFLRLAEAAFVGDLAEFDALRAIFLFYTGEFRGLKKILDEQGEGWLFGELEHEEMKSINVKVRVAGIIREVQRMIVAGKADLARDYLSRVKRQLGNTPEFQEREQEIEKTFQESDE
jgi:serine/threonine protein kinase